MHSSDHTGIEGLRPARRIPTRPGPGVRRWGRVPRLAAASAAMVALSLGGATVAGATSSSAGSKASSAAHPAGGPPGTGSPPTAAGKVTAVEADSFTLTTRTGTTVTVEVGSSTSYQDPKVTSPTLADVTVGEQVAVVGTETSDTVTATRVMIGVPGGPKGSGTGRPPTGTPPGGKPPTGKPGGTPPSGGGSSSS